MSNEELNKEVQLALELNKLVHENCKDVPHDIGIRLMDIVKKYATIHSMDITPLPEKYAKVLRKTMNRLLKDKPTKL